MSSVDLRASELDGSVSMMYVLCAFCVCSYVWVRTAVLRHPHGGFGEDGVVLQEQSTLGQSLLGSTAGGFASRLIEPRLVHDASLAVDCIFLFSDNQALLNFVTPTSLLLVTTTIKKTTRLDPPRRSTNSTNCAQFVTGHNTSRRRVVGIGKGLLGKW